MQSQSAKIEKLKKAVVLTSGGIDSTTAMAIAKNDGFSVYSLTFNYGQRHARELDAARDVAHALDVKEHLVLDIDMGKIGGSALTDNIDVPKTGIVKNEIPITYVPARNTIFLSFALAWAEVLGCKDIFIGVNALDYSGYPDCRPEFIAAFEKMANLALKASVQDKVEIRIQAPLLHMTKAAIIRTGIHLGVDYAMTHSCYDPDHEGAACGKCDSCILRKQGFETAGMPDPTRYMK
jgi:7-cyano-7-deazaguanine synthase